MKGADVRANLELSDVWLCQQSFGNENQVKQEYIWRVQHNNIREFLLVARTEKLDDIIPL